MTTATDPHLLPQAPEPRRLAWTADAAKRVRTPSIWRSRGVMSLKFLLPAVGVALVMLLIHWPDSANDERHTRLTHNNSKITMADAESLTMLDAKYSGVDDKKRPFVVTATTATQENAASDRVDLSEPKADTTQPNGLWLAGSAKTGIYARSARILDLAESVLIYQDDGTEFRTSKARLKLGIGYAEGDEPVDGQGPTMQVQAAQGFRIYDRGARIEFLGQSRVIIEQRALEHEKKPEGAAK